MPTTIPYDPSLVLGQIVNTEKIDKLQKLAKAEKKVDDAETALNSLIQANISMETTLFQFRASGKEIPNNVNTRLQELDTALNNATIRVLDAKVEAYGPGGLVEIARQENEVIDDSYKIAMSLESPVDFSKSTITRLPLSSNSITFDSQYFSFDSNDQSAKNEASSIKSFIAASVSFLGSTRSSQFGAAAEAQASSQRQLQNVIGTLVITANVTIEDAKLLEPLTLDVSKAIRVWNELNPGGDDQIFDRDYVKIRQILEETEEDESKNYHIVSGMSLGASFVGMVHVLRSERTDISQRMRSVSANLQAQMKTGAWFTHMEGGFGVNSSFSDDVKKLLSTQEISSHCSVVCMGAIPSIRANEVRVGVNAFSKFDPKAMMQGLVELNNNTTNETNNLDKSAEAARLGKQMVTMRGAEIKNVMSGLKDIDWELNKTLDINSLMTAFEDFVQQSSDGKTGIPINFYISSISKRRLALNWLEENYPDGDPAPEDVVGALNSGN